MSDPKPIRYPRNHISNVFRNVNWHDEYRYLYGPAVDNRDPIEVWNAERSAERHAFAVENEKRRAAELKAWEEAKARAEYEASPEGQHERDRAAWKEFTRHHRRKPHEV
jgi:hypothetical protein